MHLLERRGAGRVVRPRTSSSSGARSAAASASSTSGRWSTATRPTLRAIAAEVPLDPGFGPLVDALRAAGAELTVVSDGFGFYVRRRVRAARPRRAHQRGRLHDRRAAVPARGPVLPVLVVRRVQAGADQGRAYRGQTTVLVGDGASDRKAALLADVVFAKDALASWCAAFGVAFTPFDTLADVHRTAASDVKVAFGSDERTPLTDAVRADLEARGHESSSSARWRATTSEWAEVGAPSGSWSRRRGRHRRAVLLDRHRRVDRGQQGARACAPRCAPTPPPRPARGSGTTPTCW